MDNLGSTDSISGVTGGTGDVTAVGGGSVKGGNLVSGGTIYLHII